MRGFYVTKDLVCLFEISRGSLERCIKDGLIPKPIQRAHGGKRYWPCRQIDKILNGEG
jgi:hypothetical protein